MRSNLARSRVFAFGFATLKVLKAEAVDVSPPNARMSLDGGMSPLSQSSQDGVYQWIQVEYCWKAIEVHAVS